MSRKPEMEGARTRLEDYEQKAQGGALRKETHQEMAQRLIREWEGSGKPLSIDAQNIIPSINQANIPEQFQYSLKRCVDPKTGVLNMQEYHTLRRRGFELVPPDQHPELYMPGGDKAYISFGDLVLMMRPKYIEQTDRRASFDRLDNGMRSLGKSAPVDNYKGNDRVHHQWSVTESRTPVALSSEDLSEYAEK